MSIQIRSARTKTHILGVWQDTKQVPSALSRWSKDCAEVISGQSFTGKRGETSRVGSVLFVGLGKKGKLKRDDLRDIGGSVLRTLGGARLQSVCIDLHFTIPRGVANENEIGQLVGEGMTIANWRVDQFDGSATKRVKKLQALKVTSDSTELAAGLKRGVILGNAVNDARRIAATPPNICNPPWMAREAKKVAKKCGLKCRVISYVQAKELGLNGIVNVGKGSNEKPCLIILEYTPKKGRKTSQEHLCLVGKTITYDTGGYSLKISNGMKGMKYDKTVAWVFLVQWKPLQI